MRHNFQKFGQATPPASVRESSFTKSNFATSIHQFLDGINEFASIGMVDKDIPSILSKLIGLGNQILLADIGSSYIERELSIGISDIKKNNNEVRASTKTIMSSFSTSVVPRINLAFNNFLNFIKYSEELLESQNISADPAVINNYSDLKEIILREKNNPENLLVNLKKLINEISERLNAIKDIAGVNFSLIKQFLNLNSAVNVDLDVDIDTFSKDKYDLDNLPTGMVSRLSPLLREIKNLQVLINIIKDISSEYPAISAVPISGSTNRQTPTTGRSTPSSGSPSPSPTTISIDKISSTSFFNQDTPYSYKFSGLTSANPSISLELSGNFIGQSSTPLGVFDILVRSNRIIINDGSSMTNPPSALAYIATQLRSPNSGLLSLTPIRNTSKYLLTISIPAQAARQLVSHPSISIFSFVIGGQNYFIKSASNKYIFDSGFSEILFNTNDLINDSSNISKRDRQKILNKLKK